MIIMAMIFHVIIWQNIIQCVSQRVSKVLLICMVCVLFLGRKKSRKSTPEVSSTQKDAICEVPIFQVDYHRQSIQRSYETA